MTTQLDRLKSQLLTSGIQRENSALFQVINQLIDYLRQTIDTFNIALTGSSSGSGVGGTLGATYLTKNKEVILPNSLQEIAGAGIQFNDAGGKRIISTAIPFGFDGGGEGEDGPPGPPGIDGAIGPTGSQGSSGTPGMPGLDGEDGIDGNFGLPGAIGGIGPSGEAGPPGIPGIDGLDGDIGEQGIPGPTGPIGANGTIGINGALGPPGLDAEESEYPYIIPGPQGPQGIPGGSSVSALTVEKNLGATPTWTGKFTITDANITTTSKVMAWQAPGPYTGKGTRADEAEMQPVKVTMAVPTTGSVIVHWETPPMITQCMEPISQYLQTGVTNIVSNPKDPQSYSRRYARKLGKVRGNVKFSYVVFA